jgi:hypothetical protein
MRRWRSGIQSAGQFFSSVVLAFSSLGVILGIGILPLCLVLLFVVAALSVFSGRDVLVSSQDGLLSIPERILHAIAYLMAGFVCFAVFDLWRRLRG